MLFFQWVLFLSLEGVVRNMSKGSFLEGDFNRSYDIKGEARSNDCSAGLEEWRLASTRS